MSKAVITESLLTDIADAIRAKGGSSASLTPAEMAEAIAAIESTPSYLYDESTYPEHLDWPYSTMRPAQFALASLCQEGDPYFQSVDLGALTDVPAHAFRNALTGTMPAATAPHPLLSASGSEVTSIGDYGFYGCVHLATADFPKLQDIGQFGLALTAVSSLPATVRTIGFQGMRRTSVSVLDLPNLQSIGKMGLLDCQNLTTLRLGSAIESIGSQAFQGCANFDTLILDIGATAPLPTLMNVNAFSGTKIAPTNPNGYIYIMNSRTNELKAATNWSTFAPNVRPLEEYNP